MLYREILLTESDGDRVKRLEDCLLYIKSTLKALENDCSETDKTLCHARAISMAIAGVFPKWMIEERGR